MLVVACAASAGAPAASALDRPATPTPAKSSEIGQYHPFQSAWYHGKRASFSGLLAPERGSRDTGAEIRTSISTKVISRIPAAFLPRANAETAKPSLFRSRAQISSRNRASTNGQIASSNGDPRLMLQIGAAFGLIYIAFLMVWFWATRFRVRPHGSASP